MALGLSSIILGIKGASEHQELCCHNRYTFLIRWPEHCKLAISFDQVHCSLIPSNKFLLLTSSSFFGRLYYLYTAFSNASIIYQGLHGTLTLCLFSSPPLSITCLQCLAVGVVEGWNPPVAVPSLSSDTTPLWAALRSWDTHTHKHRYN